MASTDTAKNRLNKQPDRKTIHVTLGIDVVSSSSQTFQSEDKGVCPIGSYTLKQVR